MKIEYKYLLNLHSYFGHATIYIYKMHKHMYLCVCVCHVLPHIVIRLQELALLDSQNTVYKLIGPVLVKQDLDEAKVTVGKRLEYINGEMYV